MSKDKETALVQKYSLIVVYEFTKCDDVSKWN